MKVVASAGQLDRADELLDEMLRSADTQPDFITFSTLIKAHADQGKVSGAMRVLERLLAHGKLPDAITFQVVLSSCAVVPMESALVLCVYKRLLHFGMKSTTTTLSILLKAFARNQDWDGALAVLGQARERLHVQPEGRLFAQLAQACRSSGNFHNVLECYIAMVRLSAAGGVAVDAISNSRRILSVRN